MILIEAVYFCSLLDSGRYADGGRNYMVITGPYAAHPENIVLQQASFIQVISTATSLNVHLTSWRLRGAILELFLQMKFSVPK